MPTMRGNDKNGSFYRYGKTGTKYYYTAGDAVCRMNAKKLADTQGRAIESRKGGAGFFSDLLSKIVGAFREGKAEKKIREQRKKLGMKGPEGFNPEQIKRDIAQGTARTKRMLGRGRKPVGRNPIFRRRAVEPLNKKMGEVPQEPANLQVDEIEGGRMERMRPRGALGLRRQP